MSDEIVELQVQVGFLTAQVNLLNDRINKDYIANGEERLAGLENMAIDAIGTARKCITDALQRHEDRLDRIDAIEVKSENDGKVERHRIDALEAGSKDHGKVAGGVIKYGTTRARRISKL